MADDVEQVAVLAGGGVGPLARHAGRVKADVKGAAAGAVEVSRDPVAALAAAVRQVPPAHSLGAKPKRGGDGSRVHDAAPARAVHDVWHGWKLLGLAGDAPIPAAPPALAGAARRARRPDGDGLERGAMGKGTTRMRL